MIEDPDQGRRRPPGGKLATPKDLERLERVLDLTQATEANRGAASRLRTSEQVQSACAQVEARIVQREALIGGGR